MGFMEGKFVVLGVSGGIAAYRSCELARLLAKDGARVQAVLTEAAAEMVGPVTFQALTGRPAEVGRGGRLARTGMAHIDLGRDADLILVAPATANFLAKAAHGIADDVLLSTLLAVTCPVLIAPAMNTRMWEHKATQRNVATCRDELGYEIIAPGSGFLACRDVGAGRMAEPADVAARVAALLAG